MGHKLISVIFVLYRNWNNNNNNGIINFQTFSIIYQLKIEKIDNKGR